ncbi:MAG TPA: FtsX-like permease family protein, partial [Gemmatimonadaceae bacterium]|nr:FtsX-like permease family protein [Gemmatimonadaceae bacterium]
WSARALVGLLWTIGGHVSLDVAIDARVLAFTIAVALGTGLLFGLAPAWRSTRVEPQTAMKSGGRGVTEGHSRFALGRVLVMSQVALSLVLLTGAGLMVGTFRSLATLDPGFQRDQVLLASADLRNAHHSAQRQRQFSHDMVARLRAEPGVRAASASEYTPLSGAAWNNFILVDGFSPTSRDDALVDFNAVSNGYFATLGTPLLAGRDFNESDTPGSPLVAIINETLAHKFFGHASPLGKQFRVPAGKKLGPPIEVVGVVGDAKYQSLREKAPPTAYLPYSQQQDPPSFMSFELRTAGAPTALIPSVTSAFGEVNPAISLEFTTLSQQVAESLTRERLLAMLSSVFGALALALAVIGIYGIMSYTVARRRNEIGIRIALGAAGSRVLRMVLGEVGRIVIIGVLLGLGAALAATRLVSSLLYGVAPTDPAILLLAALILIAMALAAGALPAWRAARLDPVEALREE